MTIKTAERPRRYAKPVDPNRPSVIPWIALSVIVLAYYGLMNWIYFARNGWLATHGFDIWYFIAVARGKQGLLPIDATYWIAKLFSAAAPETGFAGLISIAVSLHLLSTLLVYHYLGKLTELSGDTRFLAALLFATLPQNVMLTTASFTHFSVAQPFIIAACGRLLPWSLRRSDRPDIPGLLCLLEAMVIGPEGWFALFALAAAALAWRFDLLKLVRATKCPPWLALLLACGVLALLFPWLFSAWNWFSLKLRGIDLVWQREIRSGDLLPFSNSIHFFWGFHFIWLALAVFALIKQKYAPAFFTLIFLTLSLLVVRGFYSLELAGFASLAALMSMNLIPRPRQTLVFGALAGWLILFGLASPKFSYIPPHLVRVARTIQASAIPSDQIACSPTFGFFFQAWTGLETSDDLHRAPGAWARVAALRPLQADAAMKGAKVRYLVLSSWDFKPAAGGAWLSGGLDKTLQPLADDDYQKSVIVRALSPDVPLVRPLRILGDETDPKTRERAICLTTS